METALMDVVLTGILGIAVVLGSRFVFGRGPGDIGGGGDPLFGNGDDCSGSDGD